MCYVGVHGTALRSAGIMSASDGRVLSVALGEPIHLHESSDNKNFLALQTLIHRLMMDADYSSLSDHNCRFICIASSSIKTKMDELRMKSLLAAGGWGAIDEIVTGDARATLAAGGLTNDGIAIMVGSGSVIYGRDEYGNDWQVGGWNTIIGDDGSGYEIARMTLRAIARSYDGTGAECPVLTDYVMKSLNIESLDQLVGWIDLFRDMGSQIRLASIVPAVVKAFEETGEETAKNILDETANNLLLGFRTVLNHLRWNSRDYQVILEGEVIENSHYLRTKLEEMIREIDPRAIPRVALFRPVVGATLFALSGSLELPREEQVKSLTQSVDEFPHYQREILKGSQRDD